MARMPDPVLATCRQQALDSLDRLLGVQAPYKREKSAALREVGLRATQLADDMDISLARYGS